MPPLPNELWWNIIAHAISPESNLAMVKPSVEHLHPFFPGGFAGFNEEYFYSEQLAIWNCSNIVAHNLMQVNRLWRGIAERFLYSAFYVEEEWRAKRFIDTIKLNPNLAKRLRTLVIMPRLCTKGVKKACVDSHIIQMLSTCHDIDAIVIHSDLLSSPLPLFQSLDSSRRLLLLSALGLQDEEFATFMINFKNYASLQVLELSVKSVDDHTLPSLPEHITFPSLHALILGYLDPLVIDVVGKWELPSLKELSISRWYPGVSTALLPLIQRSYDTLELFSACVDLLHDHDFHGIIRAPPLHLMNMTFNFATTMHSSPPMHPAIKTLLSHVVTLGISRFGMMTQEVERAWVRFFADPTYTPRLRSVLTDVTIDLLVLSVNLRWPLFEELRPFAEELEDRDVAFKGLTNDNTSFVPIELLLRDALEVSMSCLVMDRCSSPHQEQNALHATDENFELPVSNDNL